LITDAKDKSRGAEEPSAAEKLDRPTGDCDVLDVAPIAAGRLATVAGKVHRLRIIALDPYDVALAKLCRNDDRDYEDVMHLARAIPFDLELLEHRYESELRPYIIGNKADSQYNIQSWLEDIREERNASVS
jgi:hypothetical protein